ncbi:MAG: hypothetical protein M2R45_01994 [Verrucomicrobia subdivision 3 bacterium]|nr:hypothetical protein [Limisphaerales bacterium]MCS1414812.1 hypothetical protein [Limisphaerales bacterium]
MVEVIDHGGPSVMVCYWLGICYSGGELGFSIFKEVVRWIHAKHDLLHWMRLSEISRYWAARELTTMTLQGRTLDL